MAFLGCSFVFDEIPSEEFDLMIYDVGGTSNSTGKFASGVTIVEDKVASRWRPLFYGTKLEDKLRFTMVFGVNQDRIDRDEYLSREELETISAWLTGHNEYKLLQIEQDDLYPINYKCMITGLEMVESGMVPYALKATVECDSPYAYLPVQVFEFEISGSRTIHFKNDSTHNGYYKPRLEIDVTGGDFSIQNTTDKNRVFAFENLPAGSRTLCIDNDYEIITAVNESINLYPYFNFKFFRLVKGDNKLVVTGNGTLRIICEFPVNVGS